MSESEIISNQIKALTIFNANDTMMSVAECAKFLGVHPNTVKNRIESGEIIGEFQGGKYHIPKLQFVTTLVDSFLAIDQDKNKINEKDEFDRKMKRWFRENAAS